LEQANNKQNTVHLILDGVTHTLAQWARITGIEVHTIGKRKLRGWPDWMCLKPINFTTGKPLALRKTTRDAHQ
jgi:hypothetical protein